MVDRLLKVAKDMYKGSRAVKKAGFHRPEGAGNFDNMDDYVMSDMPIDPKVQTAIDAAGDNIPASNITPGTFGGSANYAFPTTLTINGSILNLTPTFGVSTIRSNNSDARIDYATNRTTSTQTAHRFIVNGTDIAMDIVDNKKIEMFDDLTVSGDIIVGGTVDGVDIAARDHAESHTIASHSDTTATGTELETLTDGSETTLHSHAGGGGGGGWVDDGAVVRLETIGDDVGIGTTSPDWKLDVEDSGNNVQAKFGNSKGIYLGGLDPIIGLNLYKNFGDNKFGKGSSTSYASSINFSTSSGDLSFLTSNATGDADDAASMNTILTLSQNKTVRIHGALHLIGSAPEPPEADTLYKENVCKGWINFTGTGTIAINDSFNVSGITDGGTGNYTITWDRDFANTDYCATGSIGSTGGGGSTGLRDFGIDLLAVSSLRVLARRGDNNLKDCNNVFVTAFGAQ